MSNEPESLTYAELLAHLQQLTPEQLQQPIIVWGENQGGRITDFEVLTEDYINPSGEGHEPASVYSEEEREGETAIPAGSIRLYIY